MLRIFVAVAICAAGMQVSANAQTKTPEQIASEYSTRIMEIDRASKARKAERRRQENAAIGSKCAKLGGARIGLTSEGVMKSCWGKPRKINTTTTARGTHEQWVYDGGYLYLDDGVVTSIQTSR